MATSEPSWFQLSAVKSACEADVRSDSVTVGCIEAVGSLFGSMVTFQ